MLELPSREPSRPTGHDARAEIDPQSEMLSALLLISKTTRAFYGLKLAALGFYSGQDELMVAIGDKAASVGTMAELLSVRPSTVSKMLDRMIDKGFCERTVDPKDARKTLVQITPAGSKARKQILELRRQVEADLVKHMDADACLAMKRSLADCAEHLVQQLRRIR